MNPDPVLLRTLWRRAERPGLVDPRLARTLLTRHERMVAGLPLAEILTRHTGLVSNPSAATVPIVYARAAEATHDKTHPSRELPATSPPLPTAPARPTPPQSRPVTGTTHDKTHPSRELPATSPPPPAVPASPASRGSTPATDTPSTADTTAPRRPEPARATPPDPPATPTAPTSYPLVAGSSHDKSHLSRELPATSPAPPAVPARPGLPDSTPGTATVQPDPRTTDHPDPLTSALTVRPGAPASGAGTPSIPAPATGDPAPPTVILPAVRPSVPAPATSTPVLRPVPPATPTSYPLVAGSSHDKSHLSREVPATSPPLPAVLAQPASPGRTPAHADASVTGDAAPVTRPAAPPLPVVPARQPVGARLDRPLETLAHHRSPSPAQPLPLVDLAVATARAAETHPAADPVAHRAPQAAPARDTAGQPIRQPSPNVDIGQIVDAVHRRFLRRLAVESERRGVR